MELEKVKALIDKKTRISNVSQQSLWDDLFFEQFLRRLAISKYKHLFVLKGGFLLESLVGVSQRTTMDIDLRMNAISHNNIRLITMFEEISCLNINDDVTFQIISIDDAKAKTKYVGKTVKILGKFFNVKRVFSVDIGVGDVITPSPIDYQYVSYLFGDSFNLLAYPIKSIIAEKFQALVSRGINSSRVKDIIDLLLLSKMNIDKNKLNASMANTFYFRNTEYTNENISSILFAVFHSPRIRLLFDNYVIKHQFDADITFTNCINAINYLVSLLVFIEPFKLMNYSIELHLVRHGTSETDKIGGWSNSLLTQKGKEEIHTLLNSIDTKYDLFVSSDLVRAKETAKIINTKLNMSIKYENCFRELNNGDLAHLTKSGLLKHYSDLMYTSLSMDESYPNGESPSEFYERIKGAIQKLCENNANKKILLVTHAGVFNVILSMLLGIPFSNLLMLAPKTGTILKFK